METYRYEQPMPSPPPSWGVGGGDSSSSGQQQHQAKEKRRGKRSAGIKLSTDPQSVAARERRHRISDRFRILKSLVPGGSKMDTVSMLEEAIHYVKFLKAQIWLHQAAMMLPSDGTPHPSFQSSTTNIGASLLPPPSPPLPLPPQSVLSYSMQPPLPPLPPFPCSSFQDQQEMSPQFGFNY